MRFFYTLLAAWLGFSGITWVITGHSNFFDYSALSLPQRLLIGIGGLLSGIFGFILSSRAE